jgi:hypothetical protein
MILFSLKDEPTKLMWYQNVHTATNRDFLRTLGDFWWLPSPHDLYAFVPTTDVKMWYLIKLIKNQILLNIIFSCQISNNLKNNP